MIFMRLPAIATVGVRAQKVLGRHPRGQGLGGTLPS